MNCLHCNNSIEGNAKRQYCSTRCRVAWNRNKNNKIVTKVVKTVTPSEIVTIKDIKKDFKKNKPTCTCLKYSNMCKHLTPEERDSLVSKNLKKVIEHISKDGRMKGVTFFLDDVKVCF